MYRIIFFYFNFIIVYLLFELVLLYELYNLVLLFMYLTLYFCMSYGMYYFSNTVIYEAFRLNSPSGRASVKSCYFQVVFTISICISKNYVISVSDVFFPQLSNGGFSEIFHFHPQKV